MEIPSFSSFSCISFLNSHSTQISTDDDLLLVTPGHTITHDLQFMRGHGTYPKDDALLSSVAGQVARVNKLISVNPIHSRFTGEIGDVVVGRITDIQPKRWKVDINARQDAMLLLSSVSLPGGVQRRKQESDELQMKSFFDVGDLISTEIQAFFHDGAASLHTRNYKYGKLRNGSLVVISSGLIKRLKSHFITLPCGIDLIIGLNGYIWVAKHILMTQERMDDPDALYSDENEEISNQEREKIARVCNCLNALAKRNIKIDESIIVYAYEASLGFKLNEMGKWDIQEDIVLRAKANAVV